MNTPATRATPSVLITGATGGIGIACARHLVQLGFTVFAGIRKAEDEELLHKTGSPYLIPVYLDITDEQSVQKAVETITTVVGVNGLNGLVNAAGIVVMGPLECISALDMRTQFEVNVLGLTRVTQAFLPLLRQATGRIINIGSLAGKLALPFVGPYAASKFAVEALSDAWRIELHPWSIAVALIEPDAITTPIWQKISRHLNTIDHLPQMLSLYKPIPAYLQELAEHTAYRGQPPETVAKVIAHALTTHKPRPRYSISSSPLAALIFSIVLHLPDTFRDHLLRRTLPSYE